MASRRAYWKGYLKLSLVTCPVALFPASSQSDKTHFHQINRKTGNRLRQQMVDEQTGRPVDKAQKGRGYELSKGKYVEIEPEELEAVEIESTHTIDIDTFVPAQEIDKRYYDGFNGTVLDGALRAQGMTTLVVTGTMTDICVLATVVGGFNREYRMVVVEDGVATLWPGIQDAALDILGRAFARVTSAKDVADQLAAW
jgi:Ku protein